MCNSLDRNCDAKVCQRNDLGWFYIGIKWQEGRERMGNENEMSLRVRAIHHKTIQNIPKGRGIE